MKEKKQLLLLKKSAKLESNNKHLQLDVNLAKNFAEFFYLKILSGKNPLNLNQMLNVYQ